MIDRGRTASLWTKMKGRPGFGILYRPPRVTKASERTLSAVRPDIAVFSRLL